jgi:heme exporter protein D
MTAITKYMEEIPIQKETGYFSVVIAVAFLISAYNIHPFFSDDTYFYIEISENIWRGGGSTFNGIMYTNGYHPLWALILSVFGRWLSNETGTLLFVRGLSYLFHGCGVCIIYTYVRRSGVDLSVSVALFPISLLLVGTGASGSEAFVSFFSISLVLLLFLKQEENGGWVQHATFGVSLGIMMLARLDNVFLAGFICLLSIRRVGIKTVAKYVLFASVLVIPYLAHNVLQFGHLMPISGYLKSSFPVVGPNVGEVSAVHTLLVGAIVALLPVFLWHVEESRFKDSVLVLSAASVMHYAHFFAFGKAASWYWYAVLASVTVGLLAGWIASVGVRQYRQSADNVRLRKGVALLLGAVVCGVVISKVLQPKHPARIAANKLEQTVPAGSVVYVNDWPGMMNFYSDCRVIAADGLTNNFSYFKKIKTAPKQFLREAGVEFIVLSSMGMDVLSVRGSGRMNHTVEIRNFKDGSVIARFGLKKISMEASFALPEGARLEVWRMR